MTERHFAFFRQGGGEYIREWTGPVSDPDIDPTLVGDARLAAMAVWATAVSNPQPGEIGLDVTQFGYPVGDFCWMRFYEIDRLLDWPVSHKFIQIDRATMQIDVNSESPRPIRSTAQRIVIDITGTPLEAFYGHIFGRVVRRGSAWALQPVRDVLLVSAATQRALEAARIDFDLELVADPLVREAVHA